VTVQAPSTGTVRALVLVPLRDLYNNALTNLPYYQIHTRREQH